MISRHVRIEALAIAAVAALACTDQKDPVAPRAPEKAIVYNPGGVVLQPVLPPSPTDFVEIRAGGNHTCARRYNGDVYCWGQEGQAVGYYKTIQTPTLAAQGASQIAVGDTHACMINGAGAAYCWGGGQWGQLGIQVGAQIGYGAGWVLGPQDPTNPWSTLPALSFASISASGSSTCGIAASGLFCWGLEGTPMSPNLNGVPTLIVTPNNYSPSFTQVAIGTQHVCGYISQEVDCYGADQFGQAGSDPNNTFYFPGTKMVLVTIASGLRTGVSRIAAQGDFTCADMYIGQVYCFGYNGDGELGNGPGASTWVPTAIGNGMSLRGVATGLRHACALDPNNEAWCWGYNYWGMVGSGSWSYSTPTALKVSGVSTGYQTFGATVKFRALAAGSEHTCGISTDNHIYCWGHNNLRQLGTTLVGANGQALTGGYVPAPVFVM